MKVDVLLAHKLSPQHIAVWRTIQANNRALSSPYFCPEFTMLTAAARDSSQGSVYVAVMQAEAGIAGFFPFWCGAKQKIAYPIAASLTDFQGLIVSQDFEQVHKLDTQMLLQQCGLSRWHFDHLLASQASYKHAYSSVLPSAAIDITAGYDAYMADRLTTNSGRFKGMARKRRKLAKDVGPLRYEAHVSDSAVLEQLLEWKSQQFERTGLDDLFALDWTRSLIQRIHATQSDGFAGMLSALYAGDQLVAAHMGMRSADVWHYWLPSYDHRFSKFSPGLLLLISMIEDAASRKMHTVDLGKGSDSYKPLFSNSTTLVAEGCIALPSLHWQLNLSAQKTSKALRSLVRRYAFSR